MQMTSTNTIAAVLCALLVSLSIGATPAEDSQDPRQGVSLSLMSFDGEAFVQRHDDGRKTVFTVDPRMQRFADSLFERYQVPAGAAVMLNSKTGRVITMSQRLDRRGFAKSGSVALDPSPPAASLFKLITTSALIEKGGAEIGTRTCYHGGSQRLMAEHLKDNDKLDTACASLGMALGRSINTIFAKLSDRRLKPGDLRGYAEAFGFNRPLPFDVDVPSSTAEIPSERLERARTAAGFWHTHLTPLHAAVIAQTLAQDGAMLRPYIVDHVEDEAGEVIYEGKPKFLGRPVSKETAHAVLDAMTNTVERGTARKAFKDPHGKPYLPGMKVAGKTGTLTGSKPYRAYSWFVAAAPADDPEVAMAVLVVNEPKWRIKAAAFSAFLLQEYFFGK